MNHHSWKVKTLKIAVIVIGFLIAEYGVHTGDYSLDVCGVIVIMVSMAVSLFVPQKPPNTPAPPRTETSE